jgi:hypothetical protein
LKGCYKVKVKKKKLETLVSSSSNEEEQETSSLGKTVVQPSKIQMNDEKKQNDG